jgi:hypothetical protein
MLIGGGLLFTLVAGVAAAPAALDAPAATASSVGAEPTLYLAGDSTMADNGGGGTGAVGKWD